MEIWSPSDAGTKLPVYKEHIDLTAHQFAEAVEEAWYYTPLQTKHGFGRVNGDLWVVGDWLFSDVEMPPALFQTERCHILDFSTHINLERLIFGTERGRTQDDRTILTTPDDISFSDEPVPFESIVSERRVHNVTAPRVLLDLSEDEPTALADIKATTAIGQLVFAEWDAVYAALHRGDCALSHHQLDRLAACLKIATGAHPQREDVRAHAREALFRHICRFIEANLENSKLSTGLILSEFGLSRATLYRMFEPLDGVRNYVTYRRAMSALFFISQNQGRRGVVLEACERWGFSSPANFNRTIQRLFGNSPKALLKGERILKHSAHLLSHYFRLTYNGESEAGPNFAVA